MRCLPCLTCSKPRPLADDQHDTINHDHDDDEHRWWSVDRSERPTWKELLAWQPPPLPPDIGDDNDDDDSISTSSTCAHQSIQDKIVQGNIGTVIPSKRNTIRIMLSSTFQDYSRERNFLLKDVLPFLKAFGGKFGIDIWLSEMRWGISDEAVRLNRTTEICLKEVQRCREESIGHYFCLMLGNRYGYRPAPPTLSIEQYNRAIQIVGGEDGKDDKIVTLLKKYYHLDENLVPPAYVFLRDLGKMHQKSTVAKPTAATATWKERWESLIQSMIPPNNDIQEEELIAPDGGGEDDDDTFWDEEQILSKFFDVPSITEREAIAGLLGDTAKDLGSSKRALLYHRHIEHIDDQYYRRYCDTDERTQDGKTRLDKMNSLKERTSQYMNDNGGHFRSFDINSIDDMQSYLNDFGDDFCLMVCKNIQEFVLSRSQDRHPDFFESATIKEISLHHNHAKQLFVGRESIVSKLVHHCKLGSGALVIYGTSGCGKTSILAQVAQEMQDHIAKENQTLVLRFLGISPASSTSEAVAASILSQLTLAHPIISKKALPVGVSRPSEKLQRLLRALSSADKRVVLIIDSVDQLEESDPGRLNLESWLPSLFGPSVLKNVGILLSTLPNECLDAITSIAHARVQEVPLFTKIEADDMITALSVQHKHNLQPFQREKIMNGFEKDGNGSTLYLNVAFFQSLEWRSWQDVEVPSSIHSQINVLFHALKRDLGTEFVQSVISHSTLSAASQTELQQLASIDEAVTNEVFKHHRPPDGLVPPLLLADLLERLEPYLVSREIDGVRTLYWYHRVFWEAAESIFLQNNTVKHKIHSQAVHFYSNEPIIKNNMLNIRKLHQLPFHMKSLKDWKNLGHFLETTPDALLCEVNGSTGQAKYASFWRELSKHVNEPKVEISVPMFLEKPSYSETNKILVVGDFLKEYFNAYDSALSVYVQGNLDMDETSFLDYTDEQVELMSRIGDTFTRMSKYEKAYDLLSKCYMELCKRKGEEDEVSLQTLILLSRLVKDMGRYEESLELDTKLYEVTITKYGGGDEKVADAARQLARTHYLSGRYRIAIGFYEENLRIRNSLYGNNHFQTAIALNCVGMANKVLGNYVNALKYCNEAYDVKMVLFGLNHSDTAVTIDNLGSIYHLNGDYDMAMEKYEQAWQIKKDTLGSMHCDTVMMYGNIGRLLHDQGLDLTKSRELLEENLKLRLEVLPPEHPQIAVAKSPLAQLYCDLGLYDEALKLAQEALELRLEVLGQNHPYTSFTHDTIAKIYLGLDHIDKAKEHAKESLSIRRNVYGDNSNHPRLAIAHLTNAAIFDSEGDKVQAIAEAEKAHDMNVKGLRDGHPLTQKSESFLIQLKSS